MTTKETITVRPNKDRLINLLEDVNKGRIKIPLFQREFVWKDRQIIELFDSMEKGYPIGSLLFWKPEEDFKYFEKFGPYKILEKANEVKYVLDGFQRLSTLFGALTNPNKFASVDNNDKDFLVYYDLIEEEFTYSKKKTKDYYLIPLYVLIDTFDFLGFISELQKVIFDEKEYNLLITRAKKLAKTFVDYEIPFIDITGGDITSSVDIFSRINSTGTRISTDWMVSALSYNPNASFLFSEKIEEFLNEMEELNFENLSRETILHCIESATDKAYFDVKAETLARRKDFPEIVVSTLKNIKRAVIFLIEELNVIEYKLLPYNSQLIFLTEFFRINPNPTPSIQDHLKEWFWFTSYSNYFTINSLSKQRKALNIFKKFAEGDFKSPIYVEDKSQKYIATGCPQKIDFGSVRSKTLILFMLNYTYANEMLDDRSNALSIRFLIPTIRTTGSAVFLRAGDSNIPSEYLDRKTDASFLLDKSFADESRYFITSQIKDKYHNHEYKDMVEDRFALIKNKELEFILRHNLVYQIEEA